MDSERADLTLYVTSVAQGGDIPRKGGLAITKSDMLIINKTDLAVHVDVDLNSIARDAHRARRNDPT